MKGKEMAIEIVASWKTLMRYAHEEGQARLAVRDFRTAENEAILDAAIKRHAEYRDMCLKADRMIGLEGLF